MFPKKWESARDFRGAWGSTPPRSRGGCVERLEAFSVSSPRGSWARACRTLRPQFGFAAHAMAPRAAVSRDALPRQMAFRTSENSLGKGRVTAMFATNDPANELCHRFRPFPRWSGSLSPPSGQSRGALARNFDFVEPSPSGPAAVSGSLREKPILSGKFSNMIFIRKGRNHRPRGFALVVTIALMVLLTIVAVGLLSLSAISLRSGGQASARAEAQANARMALMLAIGELQKEMGPDMRVSAEAAIFDQEPQNRSHRGGPPAALAGKLRVLGKLAQRHLRKPRKRRDSRHPGHLHVQARERCSADGCYRCRTA